MQAPTTNVELPAETVPTWNIGTAGGINLGGNGTNELNPTTTPVGTEFNIYVTELGTGSGADKQARQLAKLNIAEAKRQGKVVATDGTITGSVDDSKPYYRARNNYDITQLPTQYDGYDIIDNANTGGLVLGRPWVEVSTPATVTDGLILHYDFSNPASYPGTGTAITDLSTATNDGTVVNEYGHISYVSNGQASYFNWASNQGANGFGSCILSSEQATCKDFTMVFQPFFGPGFGGLFAQTADQSLRVYNGNTWVFPNPGNGNDWAPDSVGATTFYINGQVANQAVAGWNIMGGARTSTGFPEPGNIYIGTSGFEDRHMQGRIAVVLMYNRVLTEQEQLQNYNALKTRFGL